ncbi:MAG: VCBS repeat-containing protein [Planctomycetaceae bacterium]|nr:VCBS repeat-containing protein [Planctomycetaceae bacterium]
MGRFRSNFRSRSKRHRIADHIWGIHQDEIRLESRVLLTGNSFDGIYVGTYEGSASAFGTTINIPSEDFPDNQILKNIENGAITDYLPGPGSGSVDMSGNISFGALAQVFGFSLPIEYAGTFVHGSGGIVNGSGTWSIGSNAFGVSGNGTWVTHRLLDTPGVGAGSTFRLDSNNNSVWDAPPSGDSVFRIGNPTDIPIAGRWEPGTLFDNVGMFRDGKWYLDTGNQQYEGPLLGDLYFAFGTAGDRPVVGDWNGDGTDDIGVFRGVGAQGRFYLDANGNHIWDGTSGGDSLISFGNASDRPIVGDWNGDGTDDVGVYRDVGNAGRFYLDLNGDGTWSGPATDATFVFGIAGDNPVAGDWDGDGDDDIGVVRNGRWYLDQNGNHVWNGAAGGDKTFQFGGPTDRPLVGRWKPNDIPLLPPIQMMSLQEPTESSQFPVPETVTITADQIAVTPKPKKSSLTSDNVFAGIGTGAIEL